MATTAQARHPMQPIIQDKDGRLRFKQNAIVRYLLDHGRLDLNALAARDFAREDWQQFAQLIGYSLSGFGELPYVDRETYEAAVTLSTTEQLETEARLQHLREQVQYLRNALRHPIAELYGISPDDLGDHD